MDVVQSHCFFFCDTNESWCPHLQPIRLPYGLGARPTDPYLRDEPCDNCSLEAPDRKLRGHVDVAVSAQSKSRKLSHVSSMTTFSGCGVNHSLINTAEVVLPIRAGFRSNSLVHVAYSTSTRSIFQPGPSEARIVSRCTIRLPTPYPSITLLVVHEALARYIITTIL